jgi:protein subunit release factor B
VRKQIEELKKTRIKVELDESHIEESIAKGWGPGGQAVNKTNNAVCLLHGPTGIQVRSHKTRDLELNRRDARKRLLLALDLLYNKEASLSSMRELMARAKKHCRRRKSRRKHGSKDDDKKLDSLNLEQKSDDCT